MISAAITVSNAIFAWLAIGAVVALFVGLWMEGKGRGKK